MHHASPGKVTYFARLRFRNWRTVFGIKERDRFSHLYFIGKTGTGKSTVLETMIQQDLARGHGVALLDPHGDLVSRIAASSAVKRRDDVFYLNAPDPDQPFGYNALRHIAPSYRPLAAGGLLEVFKKTWDARSWGTRMEHLLRNSILALLDHPGATLADIPRLLANREFRRLVMKDVQNDLVREFFVRDFEAMPPRLRLEAIAPIQTKVGAFLADPRLARILTEPREELHLRRMMDEGSVLLVNLSRGSLGEDAAALLGSLLVTTIGLAAFSRSNSDSSERRPFFLYMDEFQSFTTKTIANMLSELRKYGVGIVVAHQYLAQLDPEIRHAVLGNAGTIVAFRVGADDASQLAREFSPTFRADDLLALANHEIYLRLMIDGMPSRPFSAITLTPNEVDDIADA